MTSNPYIREEIYIRTKSYKDLLKGVFTPIIEVTRENRDVINVSFLSRNSDGSTHKVYDSFDLAYIKGVVSLDLTPMFENREGWQVREILTFNVHIGKERAPRKIVRLYKKVIKRSSIEWVDKERDDDRRVYKL